MIFYKYWLIYLSEVLMNRAHRYILNHILHVVYFTNYLFSLFNDLNIAEEGNPDYYVTR